ncbi:MAG TPA: hypothetical protein VD994_00705, partial [Prosthecobacter sp.]|nr:hypothetical protein [Prosthecobacter sp.]
MIVWALLSCLAHAEVVRVSPQGATATLAAGRDRVRELRTQGERGPIEVEFAAGTYAQTEAVAFTAADSGATYRAAPGAKVIFSGGRKIEGWQEKDGIWQAKLPDAGWRFEQLWVNGRRARVARTPNVGYFNALAPANKETFADLNEPNFQAFIARPKDFAVLQAIPKSERSDVLLTVMQTWTVGQCRIEALNEEVNGIRIVGRARYPFVQYEPDQRWYLENYRAALDEPGEWFLDRDGWVYYKPLAGEQIADLEAIAPVAEKLLTID